MVEGSLVVIFDQLLCFQPFWKATINRVHKNGSHVATIKDKDLQQKLNTSKFWSVFNLNVLPTILDGRHYQDSQKWPL